MLDSDPSCKVERNDVLFRVGIEVDVTLLVADKDSSLANGTKAAVVLTAVGLA